MTLYIAKHLSLANYADFLRIQLWVSLVPFFFFGLMNGFPILAPKKRDSPRKMLVFRNSYLSWSFLALTLLVVAILVVPIQVPMSLKMILIGVVIATKLIEIMISFSLVEFQFKQQSYIRFMSEIFPPLIAFITIKQYPQISGYYGGILIGYLIVVLSFSKVIWPFRINLDRKILIEVLKVGLPIYLIWFFDYCFRSLDRYFLSFAYDDKTFAVYGFAQTLSIAVWTATMSIMGPKSQVMIHSIVKGGYSAGFTMLEAGRRQCDILSIIFGVGCLIFYSLVTEMYLPQYRGSIVLVVLLVLGSIALSNNNYRIYALTALGKTAALLKVQVGTVCLGLLGNVAIVYWRLPIELFALSSLIAIVIYGLFLKKMISLQKSDLLKVL